MRKVKKPSALTRKRRSAGTSVRKSPTVASNFRVTELDPQEKCGPDTSVQFLHRVVERTEGSTIRHLVFFDQHGWYCLHGPGCAAVKHAKNYIGWNAD